MSIAKTFIHIILSALILTPSLSVVRSIQGASNHRSSVGLFTATIQTLHNCSAGAKTFYLTMTTNPGVTVLAHNIEFSAAELGIK